ncbi:putative O-methyltransferase [Aspergillus japonicus CBS 114.51]|uniref:Putative O-methyltransferase n=1 Tax=Aspergillus japonicus CBS 114.51 TaxID=1448312 RepID=A0A8T8XFJ6_ASPJA|nr:putative O-methyltransferase [Aspergillus japonicus CBS 114.51]RAH86728.1 putative O-methyltransferase [Aspergillus japonicus CBS 114.51]
MPLPRAPWTLAKTVTSVAALGFVPVAIKFGLFDILVEIGKPAQGKEVLMAYQHSANGDEKNIPYDALYAMAGLGLVDMTVKCAYSANDITKHLVHTPSAQHGALHFTTEALLAGAFLMRRLESDGYQYPFQELQTPLQFAYQKMGNDELAQQHTYDIMAAEGRMDSFNRFMVGKFMKTATAPERLARLRYDLEPVLQDARSRRVIAMVDIGGGRGEMMLEFKQAFPDLTDKDLVVQEFNQEIREIPGLTLSTWDYKDDGSKQPIEGAGVYHLAHILHNLPDLDAARLLQKLSQAMHPQSRLLIHEFTKNANNAKIHASMIALFGGRERSASEWRQLAAVAGLRVTFEACPETGEGLVEMRKL